MQRYPIVFSVRDPVIGKGFVAGVEAHGRALMREEEHGWWIDGVYPGAVCAGGESRNEALLKFRAEYREILFDFAAAASSFEQFQQEVERFFWEETPGEAEGWHQAVLELRKDIKKAGDWLPVSKNYPEPAVKVVCLREETLEAGENPEERVELAAA